MNNVSNTSAYSSTKACAYTLFAVAFLPAYFYFMGNNIALFTYFPQTMEFRLGTVKMLESGPGMTWYGWMGYAALVGLACSSLALIPAIRNRLHGSRGAVATVVVAVILSVVLVWFYRKDFM